jgi:hypothetical protein
MNSDFNKLWKPNKRQEEFLSLPDDIFEALYGGAAGGGKSDVLLMLPFARRFYEHPKFKGIIFRRTFPELEQSLINRSKTGIGKNGPTYYDFGGTYNDQKHVWTFESGATIRFSYLTSNDDARGHKTAEYHYVGFDELTAFDEYQYTYLSSRCRTVDHDLPAIMRAASNPEGIGLAWVRERFIIPCVEGGKRIYKRESNSSSIFIPAKLSDNPHLFESDPNYVNRLRLLPLAEQKALIDGNWFIFSGQVFPEFRVERHVNEPENACHVIEPFEIPSWWPKIIACDWGFTHKTSVLWGAVSPEARIYVYREYTCQKEYISTWASNLRRLSQFDENILAVVLDPSAWQNRGTEKTINQQFHDFSLFNPEKADNDRLGGKLLVHEFLRWKKRPPRYTPSGGYNETKAQEIMRRYGVDAMKEYQKMFLPEPEEINLPRAQIFNTCKDLIRTIPLLIYNQDANDPLKAEDVAKMDGDDAYDTFRYLLKAVDRYILRVQKDSENRVKLSSILINAHNDPTHFYREMDAYDKAKNSPPSVSRYRPYFN